MKGKKLLSGMLAASLLFGANTVPAMNLISTTAMAADLVSGDFTYKTINTSTVAITGYTGEDEVVAIPALIDGKPVVRINEYAFEKCTGITKITLPDTVTTLNQYAFANCISLKEIKLPDSIKTIYQSAFLGCKALTDIDIPDSLSTISVNTFQLCTNLVNVTIPESVTTIGKGAFDSCESLANVYYSGTEEKWNSISIGEKNSCLTDADIHFKAALSPVTDFKVSSAISDAVRLNWSANITADGYIIEQNKGGEWEVLEMISDNAVTTFRVDKLFPATKYEFRIRTYKTTQDQSYFSNYVTVSATTNLTPASGLKIGGTTSDAIRLNWKLNSLSNGYMVEQLIKNEWTVIAKVLGSTTSTYRVEGLSPLTKYQFRIRPYKEIGTDTVYGAYANVSGMTNPTPVSDLKVGGTATDAVRLNWSKNTLADGYIIEQLKGEEWVKAGEITDNATTTFRIEKLTPATAYKFRVRTYKKVDSATLYGAYVNISATTNLPLVTGFKVGGSASDALRLNWDGSDSVEGYIIEQYKDNKWVRLTKIADNKTTTFRVEKLSPVTTYKFRIKSYQKINSKYVYSSYKTISCSTNPLPVAGLKIGGKATTALRLNWTKSDDADGYIIEQYKDNKWVRINKTKDNETITYRVEDLKTATTYKFRVKSYKLIGKTYVYSAYKTISGTTK